MNYIFVDLDNTLIAAEYLYNGNGPKDAKVIKFGSERYYARLRPGALDLLKTLRSKGNVYMLTAATRDYARGWNEAFNLGFINDDIYSREDTSSYVLNVDNKFPKKGEVYLIDDRDLPSEYTVEKINFIRRLALGKVNLIVVKPYHGFLNQQFSLDSIKEAVDAI